MKTAEKVTVAQSRGPLDFIQNYKHFTNGSTKQSMQVSESIYLTPRFPIRQIGEFRPLRRDRAKLRGRRMS